MRFVQADHHALAIAGEFKQRVIQLFEDLVLLSARVDSDAQLLGQRQHQCSRLEVGVGDISSDVLIIQGRKETTTEQGLAGAHLAGDLDETFAIAYRHQQRIERLLVGGAGEGEAGVGRDAEGRLAQPEVGTVHGLLRLNTSLI